VSTALEPVPHHSLWRPHFGSGIVEDSKRKRGEDVNANDRYAVEQTRDPVYGEDAYLLQDRETGSTALVLPGLGNNLMSFVAGLGDGRRLEVILGAPAGETRERSVWWGNPILFPFPNRVRDGRFRFEGEEYSLATNLDGTHHEHGLVREVPWRVEEAEGREGGAVLRSCVTTADHPSILRQYPFPFNLTVTYRLAGNSLRCDASVRNSGDRPLPMGFGLHPYFRAPLAAGGSRAECLLHIPARCHWELDPENLPTGRRLSLPPELDFDHPRPLGEIYLDHAYSDLRRAGGETICALRDPLAGVEARVRFGREFPELLVFAPTHLDTVCFEPYTCVTDAVNLAERVPNTGLLVLGPGEAWRGTVWLEVEGLV
jgi:aldose 1-epimerase